MPCKLLSEDKLMVEDITLSAVAAHTAHAISKHGAHKTPLNPVMARERKLSILMEEVGEIAMLVNDYRDGKWEGKEEAFKLSIMGEIGQVAAVAAMWLEGEDHVGTAC